MHNLIQTSIMSSQGRIIKPKPPHLRSKKKTSKDNLNSEKDSESKKEYCALDSQKIFVNIESQINLQFDIMISKLESIKSKLIEKLRTIQEKFIEMESNFETIYSELCQFIDLNVGLESKRNTLANMQNYHVDTLKRKLDLHSQDKPSPPYIGFSCETNKFLTILEGIKLITYSPNDELSSITEERIKDWKSKPESVAVDNRTGQIYYSDPDNSCVRIYDMGGGHVGEIGLWSSKMLTPKSIAILKDELYVADVGLNNISKFNLKTQDFIANTVAPLTFANPIAITFNEKEELYILDQQAKKLTVVNSNLQFIRGYNLKLTDTQVPIDFRVSDGVIYLMLEDEVVWFEEPKNSSKMSGEDKYLVYEISYNSIIKTSSGSNQHLCLDKLGNIIRTENNGQLVINSPDDGTEIFRKSFSDEGGVELLTGVCITEKGWVIVGVSNRGHILQVLKTNDFENSKVNNDEGYTYI